jgi:hypothetical protein
MTTETRSRVTWIAAIAIGIALLAILVVVLASGGGGGGGY